MVSLASLAIAASVDTFLLLPPSTGGDATLFQTLGVSVHPCTAGAGVGAGSGANVAAKEAQRERCHRLQRERNDTVVANGVNNTGV